MQRTFCFNIPATLGRDVLLLRWSQVGEEAGDLDGEEVFAAGAPAEAFELGAQAGVVVDPAAQLAAGVLGLDVGAVELCQFTEAVGTDGGNCIFHNFFLFIVIKILISSEICKFIEGENKCLRQKNPICRKLYPSITFARQGVKGLMYLCYVIKKQKFNF